MQDSRDQDDDQLIQITEKLGQMLTLQSSSSSSNHEQNNNNHDDNVPVIIDEDNGGEEEEEEEEFEFSFFGVDQIESPVSAEDAFQNGQIRPIFPLFGEVSPATPYIPPVKSVFVVSPETEREDSAEGPYCVWTKIESIPENSIPTEITPEMSRKSNSTGFSRLWRMKDMIVRSNSDGKDTFVFLSRKGTTTATKTRSKEAVDDKTKKTSSDGVKRKGKKVVMTESVAAYESLYGKKKGGGKSYLPYKQDLVGLFTNVNGFTRNLHPY